MVKLDFMTHMRLEGKKVIVTGGMSGIGLAIVSRFVKEGAIVLVADVREDSNGIIASLSSSSGRTEFIFVRLMCRIWQRLKKWWNMLLKLWVV